MKVLSLVLASFQLACLSAQAADGTVRVTSSDATRSSLIQIDGEAAQTLYERLQVAEFDSRKEATLIVTEKGAPGIACMRLQTKNKKKATYTCETRLDEARGTLESGGMPPSGPIHSPAAGGSSR